MIDQQVIKKEFPILSQTINGHPLIYLDNAATTQVPQCVIAEIREQYEKYNGNVHRGAHYLSELSTERMEHTRKLVQEFIGAKSTREIIFTSGTTESINMLSRMLEDQYIHPGDEIIVSETEHHSNLLPWQQLCKRKKARLRVIPVKDNGELDLEGYQKLLSSRTRLVAVTWVSNVLGTINDVERITAMAHRVGAFCLVDAAQAMRHMEINVQKINCDFLAFSAHKMMGPTGVGVLYGKERILNRMEPAFFGGGMVSKAQISGIEYADIPDRFEAGTPNYVGIIAFGKTLEFLEQLGMEEIYKAEAELIQAYTDCLSEKKNVRILGEPVKRAGVLTFWTEKVPSREFVQLLYQSGIAVRAGQHCAMPLLKRFQLNYAIRISPAFYNTKEELEHFSQIFDELIAGGKR